MTVAPILANVTTSLEAGTVPTMETRQLPTLNMGQVHSAAADLTESLNLTCEWTDFMDEMDPGSSAMVQ